MGSASLVGNPVATLVGNPVGSLVGNPVGSLVGNPVGSLVGNPVASLVENPVASWSYRSSLTRESEPLSSSVARQVNQVKGDVDRLSREKIDTSALEHYTSRVTHLFEQVRGGDVAA